MPKPDTSWRRNPDGTYNDKPSDPEYVKKYYHAYLKNPGEYECEYCEISLFTNLNLTDIETCYKVFRMSTVRNLVIVENRFGFEPEITAKISKIKNLRIFEVGIKYYGRNYLQGKKINWKDAISAIRCILLYNLFS
jgi:hypothetical protein